MSQFWKLGQFDEFKDLDAAFKWEFIEAHLKALWELQYPTEKETLKKKGKK